LEAGAIGTWEADLASGHFSADERTARLLMLDPNHDGRISLDRWRQIVHPEDLPTMNAVIEDLRCGRPYPRANYRIIRPDGEVRYMEVTALPVKSEDGHITHVGTLTDITEKQKSAEERETLLTQLRERVKELRVLHFAAKVLRDRPFEKEVLDELVVLLPQGFAHHEACEARIVLNDAMAVTPGWRDSPWRLSTPFTTTAGSGLVEVVYLYERPLAAEGPFWAEERILLSSFVEMLVAYLEKNEADRRKAALETKLQTSQKMEAMGTLAGGIAHDFNNLLAAINGFAALLEEDCPPRSSSRHFAERIRSACERGKQMVRQILAFARNSALELETIDLSVLVSESRELLQQTVTSSTAIDFRIADDLFIRGNAGQISQLLTNLCKNAAEALEEGTGKVDVILRTAEPKAVVAATLARPVPNRVVLGEIETDATYAELIVRDTGPGIPHDVLLRIFDPFFTTKAQRRGSGLGLAVVQRVVEAHNGCCVVDTHLKQGTSFTIFLPLTRNQPKALGLPAVHKSFLRHRILLVDDDIEVLDSTALALQRLGQDVHAVGDALKALEMFRANRNAWNVAIVDQRMPGMLGTELVSELKKLNPSLVSVLCTAHSETLELGLADVYLQKPIDPRHLVYEIETLASIKRDTYNLAAARN
jgi:signal transduction histidine kinase